MRDINLEPEASEFIETMLPRAKTKAELSMVHNGATFLSIAISLKRIADELQHRKAP